MDFRGAPSRRLLQFHCVRKGDSRIARADFRENQNFVLQANLKIYEIPQKRYSHGVTLFLYGCGRFVNRPYTSRKGIAV